MKKKKDVKVGAKVIFNTGNYAGLTGTITKVDWESKNPNAIYGFYHEVLLSNGKTGYIEKKRTF